MQGDLMKRLIIVLFFLSPFSAHAGENILSPMIGFTNWSDNTGHTARGNAIAFDDDNDLTLGFKYLYMFDSGFALGGNVFLYDKDVTTTFQANDAGVIHIHALAEYFFNPTGSVSPFIGGGIGVTGIGFSGGILDEEGTGGESIEFNGGVLFRLSKRVGFMIEYKYIDFDVDEDIDGFATNIESESQSLLFSATIHL